jgi:hypothetical protein
MHPEVADAMMVAKETVKHGALRGATPGRTDVLEISVPAESFVVPADIVSSIGQGNTEAGMQVLEQMFPPAVAERAAGGAVDKVPIVAAAGEFVIHPEHVKRVGGGDVKKGHRELEKFVKTIRAKTIQGLKKLPGPAKG